MPISIGCCSGTNIFTCLSHWYATHTRKNGMPAARRRFGVALAVLPQPIRWNAIDAIGIRHRVVTPAHVATFDMKPVISSGVVSHLLKCTFHANSSTLEATPEDTAMIASGRIPAFVWQYLHILVPLSWR